MRHCRSKEIMYILSLIYFLPLYFIFYKVSQTIKVVKRKEKRYRERKSEIKKKKKERKNMKREKVKTDGRYKKGRKN